MTIVYTIGHSNRSLAEFLNLLKEYGIEVLIDVRRFPISRKYPHFNRDALSKVLENNEIKYVWLGKLLGGYRSGGYLRHMETREYEEGIRTIIDLARKYRVAIMCSEKLWFKCHRRFISTTLVERGFRVVHIIEHGRTYEHKVLRL